MGVDAGSIARLIGGEVDEPPLRTRLWSPRWTDLLVYVLLRSRGFALRSSTRLLSDLIEVFVMSQIAVPALALLVGTVAVVNAFLNSLHEGVLRAHACAAREGRLFRPAVLLGVGAALVLAPHALLLATVQRTSDVIILVALRVLSGLVDAGVGAWTARVTIVRRPYLSPWLMLTPLVTAMAAGALSLERGGRSGVMGLAFSMAAARIFTQLAFLRAALRGSEPPPARSWPNRRDAARMLTAILPFLPAFALTARLHGTRAMPLLLLLPLFFKLAARPFQAAELDLRSAIARYGAPGVQAVLGRVAALSCALAFTCAGTTMALAALLGASLEVLLLVGWMALLATGRALVALGSTIDADLRGGWLSAAAHGAQCLLAPAPAALVAIGFVAWCLRATRPAAVAAALAPRRVVTPHGPEQFWARYDGRGVALQVRLHRAHRSRRAARALLDRWAALDPPPLLAAVDPTTFLAFWPGADTRSSGRLRFALMLATPRAVARIEPVSPDQVRALIAPPPSPATGRTWRMSEAGAWTSSDGRRAAGPEVAVLLEAQRDGDRALFCRGDAKVTDPRTGERYAARRARGRTIEVVQALVVAALALAPCPARAQQLECSPEDGTAPVRYLDELGRRWDLVDLRFDVAPWQRPHLACNRWLDSLPRRGPYTTRPLYGGGDASVARLEGDDRAELHRACAESPLCRVAFPYNLHPRGWGEELRARLAPRSEGVCQAPLAARTLRPRPARPSLEGLTEVEPWFTPITRVSDEVVRLVRATAGGAVFVSTMTVDAEEAARLAIELGRADAPRVFLLFDLNTVLAEGSFELFLRAHPGLFLVPYFNTPRDPRYYHVKGAASATRLVFSGANLKAYDRLPLFDLGFSARGATAARALSAVIAERARDACAQAPLLDCTLEARFAAGSPWPARIRAALARSCEALPQVTGSRGPFAVSDADDLAAEMIAAVAGAEAKVEGTTHHLDHPDLEQAIRRAPVARVHVGRGGGHDLPPDRVALLDALPLEVHTKALLIDDRALIWGSGNFTRGGLGESMELLFWTRQPELLDAYRRYLRTVERLSGALIPGGRAERPGAPVVAWLSDEDQRVLSRRWPSWRAAMGEVRPGLGRFFRVQAPGMAGCLRGRDGETFIHPLEDVLACSAWPAPPPPARPPVE